MPTGKESLVHAACGEARTRECVDVAKGTYDVTKFVEAVKGKGAKIKDFEKVFQIKDAKLRDLINPLLIVAAFGSPETIDQVLKWIPRKFNWNERKEIKPGFLGSELDKAKQTDATPMYVATLTKNVPFVKAVLKHADESDMALCMKNLEPRSPMESAYMIELGERLKKEHSKLKPAIIPGHKKEADGTWKRAIVVYSTEILEEKDMKKEDVCLVMLRNPNKVDGEAKIVSQKKEGKTISKADMDRANKAIEKHSKQLWHDHSNLNIISVSPVRSKNKGAALEPVVCIVLYCSTKGFVPLGEKEFPRKLKLGNSDSIGIDVREGYFELGVYAASPSTAFHQDLKMGCSIGSLMPGSGTLGPFVNYNGHFCFLTCAHVFFQNINVDFTETTSNRIDVYQPNSNLPNQTSYPCGNVERAILNPNLATSIDVAVVRICDINRVPARGRFAMDDIHRCKRTGFDELPEYNDGATTIGMSPAYPVSNMVVQFGATTHLTKGNIIVYGAQVRPRTEIFNRAPFSPTCYNGLYEVEPTKTSNVFSEPGDSGAAVFMLDKTELGCLGMTIGGTSFGNSFVTPIKPLLDVLSSNSNTCKMATFNVTPVPDAMDVD
ncbi:uncharacterized protein [Argopecten irradians]|uniref:uncharacterized protein n=1 Tax=Argopecten irradians TaxID=31199 RepID=UPI00371E2EB9